MVGGNLEKILAPFFQIPSEGENEHHPLGCGICGTELEAGREQRSWQSTQ